MSQNKIVKSLKNQAKTGEPITITVPPNNLSTVGNARGSDVLPKKARVLKACTGGQLSIPVINRELLTKLQTANLVSEIPDENLDENLEFLENSFVSDDTMEFDGIDQNIDSTGRPNNFFVERDDNETQTVEDQSGATGSLSLENSDTTYEETNSFLTTELLSHDYPHSAQCCETCRVRLSVILRTVTELNEKMNCAPASSNCVSQSVADNNNRKLLPKFPIKKVEKFKELDKQLKESHKYKAVFTVDISKIGGKNPQKATKGILDYLFTNKFASVSSWTGIHGGIKIKDTTLVQLLTEFLVAKYGATHNETKDQVHGRVKEWFQRSSERLKIERKAKEPKKSKENQENEELKEP